MIEEPFVFAPYVAAIIPSQDDPTLGHAAPGRSLQEWWLGFGAGAAGAMNQRTSFYATCLTSLHGTNGHELDQGLTLGVGFGFQALPPLAAARSARG